MVRIVRVGLIGSVGLAVLAFGGTHPLFFPLVQIVLLGLLLFISIKSRPPEKFLAPALVPAVLVGLVVFQLIPLVSSSDSSRVPISIGPYETSSHFVLLLTYISAFYLTVFLCRQRREQMKLVVALALLAVFEAAYGLVEYLTHLERIFTYERVFPMYAVAGTYINRNHFAGFVEMTLPFALSLAIYRLGAGSREKRETSGTARGLLWLMAAVLVFVSLLFSRSRMGILSGTMSLLVMVVLLATSRKLGRKHGLVLMAGFVLIAVAMAVWIGPDPIVIRYESLGREISRSEGSRWSIWRDTLALIREYPLVGRGVGTFPISYTSVQSGHLSKVVNHAHNDYLEISSDLGILAALLLFGSVFALTVRLGRDCSATKRGSTRAIGLGCVGALVAILLHSLADFNLYIPANALVFAVVSGLAYSTLQSLREESDETL